MNKIGKNINYSDVGYKLAGSYDNVLQITDKLFG